MSLGAIGRHGQGIEYFPNHVFTHQKRPGKTICPCQRRHCEANQRVGPAPAEIRCQQKSFTLGNSVKIMVMLRCPVGWPIRVDGKRFQLSGQFSHGALLRLNRFYLDFHGVIIGRSTGSSGISALPSKCAFSVAMWPSLHQRLPNGEK